MRLGSRLAIDFETCILLIGPHSRGPRHSPFHNFILSLILDRHKGASKSETRPKDDLLLELIRSFRGGMLRVDSNIRATMFRALRYLVRAS